MGNRSEWLLPSLEQGLEGERRVDGWRSTRWEAAQSKPNLLNENGEDGYGGDKKIKKKKVMLSGTTEDTNSKTNCESVSAAESCDGALVNVRLLLMHGGDF